MRNSKFLTIEEAKNKGYDVHIYEIHPFGDSYYSYKDENKITHLVRNGAAVISWRYVKLYDNWVVEYEE